MNCLEFRRTILINPNDANPALTQHQQTCVSCAAFKKDQLDFELQLKDTINVDVPDGLTSRILLAQSTGKVQTQKRQRRLYAVAASFILVVGIMVGVQLTPVTQPVEQLVLSHVNNETKHLKDQLNVKQEKINKIFSTVNMQVNSSLGTVNYAGNCDIRNKQKGVHLVIQGKNGPVTVLIMPAEKVTTRHSISDQRFHGVIVPAQRGSIAVIGEHDEVLEPYIKQIGRVIKM